MIKHLEKEGVVELQKKLQDNSGDEVTCRVMSIYLHLLDRHPEVSKESNSEEISQEIISIIHWINDIITVNTNDDDGRTWIVEYKETGGKGYNLIVDCGEIARIVCERWDKGEKPEWLYNEMRCAASQVIAFAFYEPSIEEMCKWIGEESRDEEKYVDGNDYRYNIVKVGRSAMNLINDDNYEDNNTETVLIDRDGEEMKAAYAKMDDLRELINTVIDSIGNKELKEFVSKDEDAAVGFFAVGMFSIMMPGEGVNRDSIVKDEESSRMVFELCNQMMLGEKLKCLLTDDLSKEMAFQLFKIGLRFAYEGVKDGTLPTDLGKYDVKFKGDDEEA